MTGGIFYSIGLPTVNKQVKIVSLAVALLISILFFLSPVLSLYNFANIEKEEVKEDTLQARSIINAEKLQLVATTGDYAGWDDAYNFMQDGNPRFLSSSLGEAFYSKLRLNLFCMIANDGRMVVGRAHDHDRNVQRPVPASILRHLMPGSLLLKHASPESVISGYLALPEGLLMIVSRPILTSEYKGPSRGTLIIGRFLDQDEMLRIGNLLQFKIGLLNAAANENGHTFREYLSRLAGSDYVLVQTAPDDRIAGYVQLMDIYGRVAALVRLEKERTFYHQAQKTTWSMILLYGSISLLFLIIYIILHKKLVLVHRNEQMVKNQLESFIELAVDGILSISKSGGILRVNSRICELTGYDGSELLAMRFGQLFAGEEKPVEELLAEEGGASVENTIVRRDGRFVAVEITSKEMPDGTFQCFVRDVSARKAMERELLEHHSRVNSMAIEVSLAEERERNRIAGELHDQVGPNLLLGKLKIDQLQARLPDAAYEEEFEAVKEFISNSIQDIRSLTFQLRPPILANAGLEAALRWLAQDFEQNHGIQVSVLHEGDPVRLEYGIRVTLFQAVRELMLNVVKHASAEHVRITLNNDPGTLIIIVEDDGTGFSLTHDHEVHSKSFGLFNTRQRIKYHGGQMHIDSSQGRGTRIFITVPLENETVY